MQERDFPGHVRLPLFLMQEVVPPLANGVRLLSILRQRFAEVYA